MVDRRRRTKKKARTPTEHHLCIDRLNANGMGVSGDHIVPFTLPGDDIILRTDRFGRPSTDFLTSNPTRHDAVCRHFGWSGNQCGGCVLQHMGLEESGAWKRQRVTTALSKVLSVPEEVSLYQVSPASRRRAKFALEHGSGSWQIGFKAYRRHDLVPLKECHVVTPELLAAAHALRKIVNGIFDPSSKIEVHLTHCDNGIDASLKGVDEAKLSLEGREKLADFAHAHKIIRLTVEDVPLVSLAAPQVQFGDARVDFPHGSFLQATKEGERVMQECVMRGVADARHVADLFCGMGTFSFPLATTKKVYAVDSDPRAVGALKRAAHGWPVEAEVRDLFRYPLSADDLNPYDAIVFDPPRAGAAAQMQAIAEASPQRIVAISCNPDTLARDLAVLSGQYEVTELTVIDQFLWAAHIETVAILTRRSSAI